MQQLEMFSWDQMTAADRAATLVQIRQAYWHIRNLRKGRFGQAEIRRRYRFVANQKKRLQLAGVSKREILDFLRCCRQGCRAYEREPNCLACTS